MMLSSSFFSKPNSEILIQENTHKRTTVQKIRDAERSNGSATVLAIGTANPPNVIYQADFPDFYFRVTNNEHMIDLKNKFTHICKRTMIKKRHMLLTEEILRENPHMYDPDASSLNTRQDILTSEIPKLGKEAALKAIREWGQPKSTITHVIFCTNAGVHLPGADYHLTKLLGLEPSVKRFMLYQQGCHAGGTVLRLAKDIAENNRGARVLAVCSESMLICFNGPTETRLDSLVAMSLFGDGAGAVIVGADPNESIEQPIFRLVRATQTTLPNTEGALVGPLRQVGMALRLRKDVPELISKNIEGVLDEAFYEVKIDGWNSIFMVAHPGGRRILDQVEGKLKLKKDKLETTRHVLSEFGNMASASVLFGLDEMRNKSLNQGVATTGEGFEWGVLLGFGPGLTVETIVLHSVPINS